MNRNMTGKDMCPPVRASQPPKRAGINHIDFLWLVMDRLFPSFGQLITLRFTERHDALEIKKALRALLTVYPRMRALLSGGSWIPGLRILDDSDPRLEVLFDEAFSIQEGLPYNSDAYLEYRRDFFNEPFDLRNKLFFRFRYLPDGENPVLLLSLHHVLTDARGWLHMLNTFMMILNGGKSSPLPLDRPGLIPSAIHRHWYRLPAELLASYRTYRGNMLKKKDDIPVIHARTADFNTFGRADLHLGELSHPCSSLHEQSERLGCSIFAFTELCIAALSMAIRDMAMDNRGNTVQIYFIIDMRPLFHGEKPVLGNYLLLGMIRIPVSVFGDRRELVATVRTELMENIRQVKRRETIFPMMLNGLSIFMGLKNYTRAARYAKRSGRVPLTYIFSNIGQSDRLNMYGKRAGIREIIGTVPQNGIFISTSILNDRINAGISYPLDIFTREEIGEFFKKFDDSLGILLSS